MLKPYRVASGKIRVLDTTTNTVLPVDDPRCARFAAMSDLELRLAGGAPGSATLVDPDAPFVVDIPIHAARGRTTSTIIHAPVAPPSPVVHGVQQITEAERAVCRQLGISEAAFMAQRRAEQTGAGGASRWRSGAAGGDE